MTLTSEEKEFIKGHAYLFDESREVDFFVAALEQFPNGPNFRHIVNYIQDVCKMDTTEYLLKLFTIELLKNIDYYKKQPRYEDPSNSWSRLQWQVSGIGDFGLKYAQIVEYLDRNKDELGIKMIPLPLPYGWEGNDDYDLGWFNREEFDKQHSEEEWYS